ncbi:MAG: XdhC family protein [Lentisphaeria bacterium]|nr:XdhC family protein [Candidatus Neomarinimicrobiota bacterium]MCF7841478.1 XdhC family protein [Lentisphaeria bacterium]
MEKHIYKILTEYDFMQPAAICSVVDSKGSVPRKDYPFMLVLADKTTSGTVGGGQLEHRVSQQAQNVLQTGEPQLLHFDLTGEDPTDEAGLCGGTATVLVESFTRDLQQQFQQLNWEQAQSEAHLVLVHFDTNAGTVQRIWDWESPADNDIRAMFESESQGKLADSPGNGYWYRHLLTPPPVIHIFGAGHVGQRVAELAAFLDLDVMVYDDRAEMASKERFPFAGGLHVESFQNLIESFSPGSGDYVLVMTKGHRYDHLLIRRLLTLDIAYLGLMASKRKWAVLQKSLADEGFRPDQLNRVHAPLGLDIGSETVPEIAVSIMSEVIHHLRLRKRSPIALVEAAR